MATLRKLTVHYNQDTVQNPSRSFGWSWTDLHDILSHWENGHRPDIKSVHMDSTEVTRDSWRATALVMGITDSGPLTN